MALIKCPECGKEISDKAAACINCGCPVSEMQTKPKELPKDFQLNDLLGDYFSKGGTRTVTQKPTNAAPQKPANPAPQKPANPAPQKPTNPTPQSPIKPVPKELPEMKLFSGVLSKILGKFCGMAGLAGFFSLGSFIVNLLTVDTMDWELLQIAILCLAGSYILAWLDNRLSFRHAKNFLRKNGYEASIRNDDASLKNSLNAFGLCPGKPMARYIKGLNPIAGNALEMGVNQAIAKKRKKRLSYLPYIVILAAVYYLLPRYGYILFPTPSMCLIAIHVITAIIFCVLGYKNEPSLGMVVVAAVLYAPAFFAYCDSEMWYYIVICAAAAFVGMLVGSKLSSKK